MVKYLMMYTVAKYPVLYNLACLDAFNIYSSKSLPIQYSKLYDNKPYYRAVLPSVEGNYGIEEIDIIRN